LPAVSGIDWKLSGWTRDNVATTIWLNYNNANKGSNFATCTAAGSSVNWTGNIGTEAGLISPTQGFWVRSSAATTLTVHNTERVHTANNLSKLQSANNQIIRLKASRNNYSDETLLSFKTDATTDIDNFDGEKKMGYGAYPQIFTQVDGKNIAINSLPEITAGEVLTIPLYFQSDSTGTITIEASEFEGINNQISIYLEDSEMNTFTDLRMTPIYNFTSVNSSLSTRFTLHFGLSNPTNVSTLENENVNIYSSGEMVYVNTNSNNFKVEIFDLYGRNIVSENIKSSTATFMMPLQGAYLVKVICEGRIETKRVFIQK